MTYQIAPIPRATLIIREAHHFLREVTLSQRCLFIQLLPLLLFAFTILPIGMAEANDTWIDQLNNTVLFYQQSYPNVDWQQYLGRVAAIRDGLATGDEATVQTAQGELIRMWSVREYGIQDAAADDLFQMMASREVEPLHEMPVSVPDRTLPAR